MNKSVEQLQTVRETIAAAAAEAKRNETSVTLVAVSKTFEAADIRPVIEAGQRVFGENRVQEAQGKWPALKQAFPDIELHLIGPLQSNKAKEAVALFDSSRPSTARRSPPRSPRRWTSRAGAELFVQVNTGAEPQKAGIAPREAVAFVARCRAGMASPSSGLMCIPPADENPGPHFALLAKLAREAGLATLHGHVRRLRARRRLRRHQRARRLRHLRQPLTARVR